MKLSKELCLGGRFNDKDIIGIKYGDEIIYSWYSNVPITSIVTYTFNGSNCRTITTGPFNNHHTEDHTNSDGTTTRQITFECTSNEPIEIAFINEDRNNLIQIDQMKGFFNFSGVFFDCQNLKYINLSEADTSKTTLMNYMFKGNYALMELDLSTFDTSNVVNMSYMFNCFSYNITTLDLSNFDTRKVTDMKDMFSYWMALTELDLSNFDTKKVTDMRNMFNNCVNLTTLNLSNFNISHLTDYDVQYMFESCDKLRELRLDNCNNTTINRIITSSNFPTNTVEGVLKRRIYCKQENAAGLTAPTNWVFEYID